MSTRERSEEEKARIKEYGRESRFTFRNIAEHQLRKDLKEEALEICKPFLGKFAECSQEKGLMVVFSCRKQFKAVQDCLSVHNSEEKWLEYKAAHAEELSVRSQGKKYEKQK